MILLGKRERERERDAPFLVGGARIGRMLRPIGCASRKGRLYISARVRRSPASSLVDFLVNAIYCAKISHDRSYPFAQRH